jgi:diguanylate cyclase (GGDEF)-like protein/PAS domain S-box-containing protein
MWQSLIANFAVVGLFGFGWLHAQDLLRQVKRRDRHAIFGVVMGAGGIASMLMSSELQPGVYFDLRGCFIAMAAFLGGPAAVLISTILAGSFRVVLGGAGVLGALMSLALVSAIGLIARALRARYGGGWIAILLFAAASAVAPIAGFVLLPEVALGPALAVAPPIILLGLVSTFAATCFLVHGEIKTKEQKLLRAAFDQAPDYLFVKDRESRFVAVNSLAATDHGFASPVELRGRSDFDVVPHELARRLFNTEQELLRTGGSILDREELVDPDANPPRWVLTSKVAVRNIDGEVIGLAGAARDISERKALEQALLEGRKQLDLVLTAMSDGLARFDANGVLVFSNEQYRAMFPLTRDVRVPGVSLADILSAAAERGEQKHIPKNRDKWVAAVVATLVTGGEEEVPLFDGHWLHIRTRPMSGGGATVVVSDITNLKRAEAGLLALTEQLKTMATTDALTGLANRRGFDERLSDETLRAARNRLPLSLIMVDIDRFKSYNDRYGHQAGDDCLKLVAAALRAGLRRPADIAARYGGEEMALILPETDQQGAWELAEQLRQAVRALALAHACSDKTIVTVSLGVATLDPGAGTEAAMELVRRADAALYIAKDAGRDRVMGWGERHAARA